MRSAASFFSINALPHFYMLKIELGHQVYYSQRQNCVDVYHAFYRLVLWPYIALRHNIDKGFHFRFGAGTSIINHA